ncbi:type IV pilus secretin PilQ family protein [Pseudoluteimonas lycopersici]|uniref:Type IV pilus secretin PilQ family protein n=1 Tax=Pseudoluteimonas lycopersici TaxID=1324796 RepID=A0A516V550_9GAMM|nr:type IV pilus secretin PilQ family protein [Lysobacter lycopersici]QDQ73660.1 type IV pilus secretin PilQ family protein [Lysobacter lycopersici]
MTVTNVQRLRPAARPLPLRASLAGIAIGLCAALGTTASAAPATGNQTTNAVAVDPAKSLPSTVSISSIDFKRGDGGAGRLILHFSGDGAAPDLRTQGSSVLVDIGNAQLPATLQKPLDVTDFATPVQRIDAAQTGHGAQLQLSTSGQFESLAYQTGRDYIVEIVPRAATPNANRAVGAVSGTVASGAQASAYGAPHYSGRPVTFNFQDVPVRTVLQLIAEESNLNVVAADTVQGNVTLRLVNVPWDQALDLVLQAKGLDKRQSGNVVWVAPQSEIAKYEQDKAEARVKLENSAEMITEYIPINYGNSEDIAKLLTDDAKNGKGGGGSGESQRGFLSPRGSISFDRRTNTLLVIDIPQRVAAIRDLVNKLDKPVDQVVIEARIVIANESFARELGAKFGVSGSNNNAYFSGNLDANSATRTSQYTTNQANQAALNTYQAALDAYNNCTGGDCGSAPIPPVLQSPTITRGLMSSLPSALAGSGSLALSILNAGYLLDMELSAMQTEGRGEIISNPRIVTSNQKEALIKQGDQIGYITVTAGNNANVPQVQFKDVVLQLKVTPTITNDGRIFLNMDLQKDDLSGYVNTGVGQVPQIATREVTTAVLVDDGQTVVVGGVYEFKDQNSLSKIPFLGDIPILGNLFKNRNHTKSKAELLVFVTPKVIRVAQRPN